jgi:hypothetical protein
VSFEVNGVILSVEVQRVNRGRGGMETSAPTTSIDQKVLVLGSVGSTIEGRDRI